MRGIRIPTIDPKLDEPMAQLGRGATKFVGASRRPRLESLNVPRAGISLETDPMYDR